MKSTLKYVTFIQHETFICQYLLLLISRGSVVMAPSGLELSSHYYPYILLVDTE